MPDSATITDDIRLPLTSADVLGGRMEQLRELFPEAFVEGQIDFDRLRNALGDFVGEGRERYGLSWAGKADAIRAIQAPSVGTLVPCTDESVNFDTTENLFIEGDNLEVLKLLQKSYYGKVKMIYIDPPYNTGGEFIYPDNYREGLEDYLKYSGQLAEGGVKLSTNTETSGRYHSKWLDMMYPRLFLARNLLRQDGVIFVSIDDHEVHNLRLLMDEVFGEENLIGTMIWKNATDNNPTQIATEHEYIIAYARTRPSVEAVWQTQVSEVKDRLVQIGKDFIKKYPDDQERQHAYSEWFGRNKAFLWPLDRYKYIDAGGIYTGSQSVHNPGREGYRYDVPHPRTGKPCKQPLMGYRFPWETLQTLLAEDRVLFGEDENKIIELKVYAKDFADKLPSVITLDGRLGAYDLRELFPECPRVFTNPKPVRLLTQVFSFVLSNNEILLDFFAGSASSAHAVMALNHQDRAKRRFIQVQLPEACPADSPSFKAGFKTISQIGRERIRRALSQLTRRDEEEKRPLLEGETPLDLGFKAFRLSSSNFKIWEGIEGETSEALKDKLNLFADHVQPDREEHDILYELMLKAGLSLTAAIDEKTVAGLRVYLIAEGLLAICLANPISQECLRGIIELEPQRVICLDAAFGGNDQLKTNTVLEMKSHGIEFRTV